MNLNGNQHIAPNETDQSEIDGLLRHPRTAETAEETQLRAPESKEIPDPEHTDPAEFATRGKATTKESIGKSRLLLLGGGLLVAVLFFVFTALVGKSHRGPSIKSHPSQQTKQSSAPQSKGSVTPVMETTRPPSADNSAGQLAPGDIRRTRSSDAKPSPSQVGSPSAGLSRTNPTGSLGSVPSFADTQQRWEEPRPYGEPNPPAQPPTNQQNGLKEPSLVFVHAVVQGSSSNLSALNTDTASPLFEITPGTRIQAKLETQISSAVLAPVVAVVEYTYQIGDHIVVPAGARVYGQLQQADRNGFVSVKFEEIEMNGSREKIDAVGTSLDLGPIRGSVYGKNNGRNFLVRAGAGIGSVLAEIAGNNTSAAFSEEDMLRERIAENIGTAGDAEIMNLNANSRIVVSVPADTKIYVVFTKHERSTQPSAKPQAATP